MLARCINASCTEGALALGEYYYLQPLPIEESPMKIIANVRAYVIADEDMKEENFVINYNERIWIFPDRGSVSYKQLVYVGPIYRFEVLSPGDSNLKAACATIQARIDFVLGKYKR